jgi:sterol desaturase/sphingolipid hydroxylase (fatty acid hydroxylase superfamily)
LPVIGEVEQRILYDGGLLLGALIAAAAQSAWPHAALRGSLRVNAALWLTATLLTGATCTLGGWCSYTAAARAASAGFGLLNLVPLPFALEIAVTILALDFVSYLWHRANHRVPFLWRFHGVHHSDIDFTVSTGLRFHPGEILLSLPVRLSAVALVGAPVAAVLVFEVVFNFANLFEHGNVDLPAGLERRLHRIFVTPALHRRHHTRRRPELDSNFSTIFSFWDRSLGTLRECTSAEHIDTGLPGVERSLSFLQALRLPFGRPPQRE